MGAPVKPSRVLRGMREKTVKQAVSELRQAFSNVRGVKEDAREQLRLYRQVYIETNSAKPVYHTIAALTAFSYALAWPSEFAHKKVCILRLLASFLLLHCSSGSPLCSRLATTCFKLPCSSSHSCEPCAPGLSIFPSLLANTCSKTSLPVPPTSQTRSHQSLLCQVPQFHVHPSSCICSADHHLPSVSLLTQQAEERAAREGSSGGH